MSDRHADRFWLVDQAEGSRSSCPARRGGVHGPPAPVLVGEAHKVGKDWRLLEEGPMPHSLCINEAAAKEVRGGAAAEGRGNIRLDIALS